MALQQKATKDTRRSLLPSFLRERSRHTECAVRLEVRKATAHGVCLLLSKSIDDLERNGRQHAD